MRAVRGVINGVLMVTLIKPVVRVMVGRWRKRAQESPAAVIGIQMQELFEAALVEELAPPASELEVMPAEIADMTEDSEGRSMFRLALLAGIVIAVATATAYAVAGYIERRREAQAQESELIAIPVEPESDETIEDAAQEALVEEG